MAALEASVTDLRERRAAKAKKSPKKAARKKAS
jgi:hypothetical protein